MRSQVYNVAQELTGFVEASLESKNTCEFATTSTIAISPLSIATDCVVLLLSMVCSYPNQNGTRLNI